MLDEEILEEATRVSGEKTYSAAGMRALEDFVRRAKARKIPDFDDVVACLSIVQEALQGFRGEGAYRGAEKIGSVGDAGKAVLRPEAPGGGEIRLGAQGRVCLGAVSERM